MTANLSFNLELKKLSDREFEGHGSVFGNVDLGRDVVARGAFKKSLAEHRKNRTLPQMFWMHRPDQVPGAWTAVKEDDEGLYVKGVLADTQLGNEMHTLLKMKAVRGLSIGFRTKDADYNDDGVRVIKEVDLWEVSLVSLAMNPLARVEAVKSRLSDVGEYVPTEREFEQALRDVGCSRKVARHITSRVFDDETTSGMLGGKSRRDAGEVDDEEALLLKAIHRWTDKVGAAALKR